MRHVIHIWLVCVSAIAIIQALPFELSESASYKNLENGLILLRFHFNASYQSESDCEPGFCLFRYGDTPRAYLDTLLELELSHYQLDVARGAWDSWRWGPAESRVSPDGVSMYGQFKADSTVSRHAASWAQLREQLSGRYGVAVLRHCPLYTPFLAPVLSTSSTRPASKDVSSTQWVQHVPGGESGGSGGGGVCTDTVGPARWLDDSWQTANTTFVRTIMDVPLVQLLRHSPYITSSIKVTLANSNCDQPGSSRHGHCDHTVQSLLQLQFVLPQSALDNGWLSLRGITASSSDDADTINLSRTVVDSKESDVHFLTVVNNSGTTEAHLVVTDVLPVHVYIPLSQYVYQFICNPDHYPAASGIHKSCVNETDYTLGKKVKEECRVMNHWIPSNHSANEVATSISSSFVLPPHCALVMRVTGWKRFLTRESMPGDASRGIEVPPVLVQALLDMSSADAAPSTCHSTGNAVRTINTRMLSLLSRATLISLPIPDASMPFNVLTLVSTVAAFLLGSVLSAIVRKSSRVSKIHNNDISSLTGSEIITNRAVVPPDGFSISPRTVSASVEERFMKWMSDVAPPWERSIEGRQVLQYGPARFDYGLQTVLPSPHAPPIPVAIVDMFFGYIPAGVRNGLSQCIINEYRAGDSIPFHTDDVLFGEDIFVFCLGEARPLLLRRPLRAISAVDGSGVMDALTEEGTIYEYWQVDAAATVRGMYHLCGPARYAWQHAVPAAPSSAPAHKARYSVTFRSVL